MKLTIFHQKENIDFLFRFIPVSEEFFIEYKSCAVDSSWDLDMDTTLSERLSSTENCLIILNSQSAVSKWVPYILGYAEGKKLNCHIYSEEQKLPSWCSRFNISRTIDDLAGYYGEYNNEWLESATVRIARKVLNDQRKDITLSSFVETVKAGDCMLGGIYMEAGYSPSARDQNGVPLICWAARSRKLPMIKLLMQAGADINAVSDDRNGTALIDAVSEDDYECVSFLLQYNPDLEVESKNGQTALTIASGHNNADIVRLLVEKGADIHKKDKLGMSALTYAKLQNSSEILKIFEGQ